MSGGGRFIVEKAFLVGGQPLAKNTVVELTDGQLIGWLLTAGKITPADEATAARCVKRDFASWSVPETPGRINRVGDGVTPTPWPLGRRR